MKKNKFKKLPKYNIGRISSYGPVGGKPWESAMQSTPLDSLPQPTLSSGAQLNIGNAVGSVANFASNVANTFSEPTLTGTNKTYTTSGPISYQKTDYVHNEDEYNALKKQNTTNALATVGSGATAGAAIGSIIPGVGTAIGGVVGAVGGAIASIFGAGKRKRELKRKIRNENKNITRKNQFNLADAHSDILEQDYYSEYEDTQDDVLYANEGKTPFEGEDKANALVGKGETIIDGNTGDMTEVKSGSAVGVDDVPAVIKPEDAVAGNKTNPRTGNTFAEDMKPLTRMENKLKRNTERNIKSIAANTEKLVKAYTQPLVNRLIAEQASVLENSNKPKYDKGKSPKETIESLYGYAQPVLSTISALMPSIWNTAQGMQKPEKVTADELYSKNAYANKALSTMAKRRYNVKPELNALNSLERRQRYNSRQLGSEGGLNRALDLAGTLGLANQISNVYAKKQSADNAYTAEYANMAAQLGAQEAANRSTAMKLAYETNARNRATQKAYQLAALTGFANYAQQQQLNANRKRMDDAKLRVLEKYYGLGTTQDNIKYLLDPLK